MVSFNISLNRIAQWHIIHDTIDVKTLTQICILFRCIFFAFLIPEIFGFLRAARVCFEKHVHRPKPRDFLVIFGLESCHVAGVAILFYGALPYMDSLRALVSTR